MVGTKAMVITLNPVIDEDLFNNIWSFHVISRRADHYIVNFLARRSPFDLGDGQTSCTLDIDFVLWACN